MGCYSAGIRLGKAILNDCFCIFIDDTKFLLCMLTSIYVSNYHQFSLYTLKMADNCRKQSLQLMRRRQRPEKNKIYTNFPTMEEEQVGRSYICAVIQKKTLAFLTLHFPPYYCQYLFCIIIIYTNTKTYKKQVQLIITQKIPT